VEVQERATTCPLCGAPIQRLDEPRPEPPRFPEQSVAAAAAARPSRRLRSLAWLLASVLLGSAALTCLAVDLVRGGGLGWSLPTLAGLGVSWAYVSLVLLLARRPIAVIVGQAVTTTGFLVVVDLLDGTLEWFVSLGLPIVGVVTGAAILVWLAGRLSRRDPLIVTAAALLAGAAACAGIDLLVSAHAATASMSWSLIVLAAVLAPIATLVYLRIRFARRGELARILHA